MDFSPPSHWTRIDTLDLHTAGEPLRLILSGFPEPEGESMLGKRRWCRENTDQLRRALMWEPRGHADMYGALLTEPATDDGDAGLIFMHNQGFSTMCGHGVIAVVTAALQCGLLEPKGGPEDLRLDTPAGRVAARANMNGGVVDSVAFRNVESFVLESDLRVDISRVGEVSCEVAFGGAFYAFVEASEVGLELTPDEYDGIIRLGRLVKQKVSEACRIRHPEGGEELNFLYGTIFTAPAEDPVHSRNVCVFADGEVDRSPTGTGVSARAALLCARGGLDLGESIAVESILGTRFRVRAIEETHVGPLPAIIPEVSGSAHITGRHQFLIDPADPLASGFLLR